MMISGGMFFNLNISLFTTIPSQSSEPLRHKFHVEKDTVSKEREHNEIDRGEHAAANPSLRLDPVVHDGVPILSSQNLSKTELNKTADSGLQSATEISQSAELNYFTD